jgi:hypothetical protein
VPDYDAFGREIGADPLAALRDATAAPVERPATPSPAPEPEPAVRVEAAEPAFTPPVVARPQFVRRRRRRRGGLAGLIVAVAVIGGIGVAVNGAVDRLEVLVEDVPSLDGSQPVDGTLLRPANLAGALELMRQSNLGDPIRLRVRPSRVDATLGGPLGVSRIRIDENLLFTTPTLADQRGYPRPVPLRRIDPTAPQRLADGRPVEYVELIRGRPVRWRAVLADGTTVTGDAAGRPD